MDFAPSFTDSDTLREQLMSRQPMQRIKALHTLEIDVGPDAGPARVAAAGAAARFAARGIPFYAADEPTFRAWVDKAVTLWQRLQATDGFHAPVARFAAAEVSHHA